MGGKAERGGSGGQDRKVAELLRRGESAHRTASDATPKPPIRRFSRGFCSEDTWRELATEICASSVERVDFYGIVPRALLHALLERVRDCESHRSRLLPPISYYTPHPSDVLTTYNERVRIGLAHRWQVGFMGLRNLIDAANTNYPGDGKTEKATSSLFTIKTLFNHCIIRIRRASGQETIRIYLALPLHDKVDEDSRVFELEPGVASEAEMSEYLTELASQAGPLQLREVFCEVGPSGAYKASDGHKPSLAINGLAPFGAERTTPGPLRLNPVAIVVLRCSFPEGDRVILKTRNVWTDLDKFGSRSLLSARVQEADIAAAHSIPISEESNDERAFHDLWVRAGQLSPFMLSEEALRYAARREIFVTCGLVIDDERLEYEGCFVAQDNTGSDQYGYGVFHMDLKRHPEDEIAQVTGRKSVILEAYPIDQLNSGQHGLDLNRLLTVGRDWLAETALAETRVAKGPV